MVIDIDNKIIFIHIPKSAGTSITEALLGKSDNSDPHRRVSPKYSIDPSWKKFAVIRDPYDRAVSIFEYQKKMASSSINLSMFKQRKFIRENNPSFLQYLRYLKSNKSSFMEVHSRPQSHWLFDDMKRKLKELNSSNRLNLSEYYKTEESKNLIRILYEDDFNLMAKLTK
jgi:chondroitin 4-sulfotransferase 11